MTNELQRSDGQAVALATPRSQVDALIVEILPAIRGGTDPAVVEKQIALFERLMAMKSKESYDSAMLVCRKAMKEVFKASRNESNNSFFAKLEDIDRMAYPVYEANGFTLSWRQGKADNSDWTRIVCDVGHVGGHHEYPFLDGPMDDKGPKGTPNKTGIQGMGSTWTYLQRRLLSMIFNIRVVGEDDDGQRRVQRPRGPIAPPDALKEAKRKLWELLKPVRGEKKDWLAAEAWLDKNKIIERNQEISKLSAEQLQIVIEKAEICLNPQL